MKAIWKDQVIAESNNTVVVENNHYFPPECLNRDLLRPSAQTTFCPWKGTASYFDVVVDGETSAASAWYYPEPKDAAKEIKDHVAFWRGVKVVQ